MWDVLEVYYDSDSIGGNGMVFEEAEFFEPNVIPLNIRPPYPEWLNTQPAFVHDADYRHVTIHGVKFVLSPMRARIVKVLDEARLRGAPWLDGKRLLSKVGSTESKMINVFKGESRWRKLIDSDGKGGYRLNV